MGDWNELRIRDIRNAFRLIGECRDFSSEPDLWQLRACEGLTRLIGAPTNGGEGIVGVDGGTTPVSAIQFGFDSQTLVLYGEYHRANVTNDDLFYAAVARMPARRVTRTRSELVRDDVYFRSSVFEQYLEPADVHHRLMSVRHSADGGRVSVLHLHRASSDRDFSARERLLVDFFHAELGRLIGRSLVSAAEPSPSILPRRLRQTLVCLIQGDSEKEIAIRLGLSQLTAHQYVGALYRRFGVRSRGQLLAYVLKRSRRPEWLQLLDVEPTVGMRAD
ncbi:MAG TPA: helix-turn-helix transcriptional regulator [Candidatus Limnocylindrales bacterium]|nr:helix-turn-helix transcriptional regulator [Candidatus Limnocylindrales bacterium]